MAHGAQRASALIACAMGALAIFLSSASAQPARSINQVERDRSAENARAQRLRRQAAAARAEVDGLNTRLVESGRRRAEAETAATQAEQRLVVLQAQLTADGARYRNERDAFERTLILAALAQHRLEPSAVRAGIFARAAAPAFNDAQRLTAVSLDMNHRLEDQINEERSILADAQSAIDSERAELVTLLAQRRTLQASLDNDAAIAEARVRRLAAEARTLRELAERVQRAAATPRRTSPGPSIIPAAWLAPASGSIVRNFGAQDAGGPTAQGATLRTRTRAQVVSPASGEVAYAGLFRSYGQVLILNLDGGYAVVLAGLESARTRVGETVQAGQPIGEMSSSDTPAPELYVEVRRNGQPIDPARWLNARGLAAGQGNDRDG